MAATMPFRTSEVASLFTADTESADVDATVGTSGERVPVAALVVEEVPPLLHAARARATPQIALFMRRPSALCSLGDRHVSGRSMNHPPVASTTRARILPSTPSTDRLPR